MAVTALDIKSRRPFAGGLAFGGAGPYEQLDGAVQFAVDPDHPANGLITDLKLGPRDARGLVNFSADFRVLQRVEPRQGNHRILLDVLNRGGQRVLRHMNSAPEIADPTAPMDPGNGFLMRQGYTVVWCGWQHDVPTVPGLLRIQVPEAQTPQGLVSGKLAVTFQVNAPAKVELLADRQHRPYPANNLQDPEAVLTVRDHDDAPPRVVPRDQWAFARLEQERVVPDASHICLSSGFQPGKVYQVVYATTGAPILGLGLLATRDLVSFLRYETGPAVNPCAGDIQYAYAFGASQSGRFLRHFLYLALNQDEDDRIVFDGILAHIGGGRRGEFNQRFGQPSSVIERSVSSLFPFADTQQTDPETGRTDGLLSKLAARRKLPRVFFTNSSAEYWGGHAALIHTDVAGARDLTPLDSVRIYHFAGTQHASGTFPLADANPANGTRGRQLFNCVDYRPLLRSALVRLDQWVTSREAPPPSRHPRINDGTAVPPEQVAATFRAIPGVNFPQHLRRLYRLDFGPDQVKITKLPPVVGKPYPSLVSAVDQDGNELAGIRLPDIAVPLATHTGWNLRHQDTGGPGQIIRLVGSTIPFLATRAGREAFGDPRLSIEERYSSREDYLEQVRQAAQALIDEGYLLAEDLETVVDQAAQRYDLFHIHIKEAQMADN